jgi:hypothetical protein
MQQHRREGRIPTSAPAFLSSSLDLNRLRAFTKPVLFALGGRSNPGCDRLEAERAREIFPDFCAR